MKVRWAAAKTQTGQAAYLVQIAGRTAGRKGQLAEFRLEIRVWSLPPSETDGPCPCSPSSMPIPQSPPSASGSGLQVELIGILQQMVPPGSVITAQTRILTDLDLDSLKMIELIDLLNARYGVDFLEAPHSLSSLQSVETLEEALKAAARSG